MAIFRQIKATMIAKTVKTLIFLFLVSFSAQALEVNRLKVEHLTDPIGVAFNHPRFSWNIESDGYGVYQTAYQIVLFSDDKEVWNSGKVMSGQSNLIPYLGPALTSRSRYQWQVKVWDNQQHESLFSEFAFFEIGFLESSEWKADWITVPWEEDPRQKNPAHYYRYEATLKSGVKRARMYITSHGLYEAGINGQKVGDQEFTPGWTSYEKRLQYQVYDITSMLTEGNNCFSAMVADGWHRGRIAYRGKDNPFRNQLSLLMQIEVEYENGKKELILTDKKWKASTGGILESTIYDGEVFDLSKEPMGWQKPAFNQDSWQAVKVLDLDKSQLIATHVAPVKVVEKIQPVKAYKIGDRDMVYDFGQNITGRVSVQVEGYDFEKIEVGYAEEIDQNNDLYTKNLRDAKARVSFTIGNQGRFTYKPHFTYMGFRYVKVSGIPTHRVHSVRAEVIHSDLEPTGVFECSNKMVNQLYSNIRWSQKDNFLDIPTDCPQRDERLGWTGDAQVFSTTAAYNMDVAAFFNKWLADLAADQQSDGSVPWVIPNVFNYYRAPATGWADAAVILPWNLYRIYGDEAILETQYASMKAWVEFMISNSENGLWYGTRHFGDWLSYLPEDKPHIRPAVTEDDLLAAMYYQHSMNLLARIAGILGKTEDAARYSAQFMTANDAFLKEFVTPNGRLVSGTQTAYVLALSFGILPESMRANAVDRLVENIHDYGHLTTGFLGASELNFVLSEYGHADLAYTLLLRKKYPSWLYPVTKGATTIWERWDGKRPDLTFQNPKLNSFNHYAYGAIGSWMIEHAAGIKPCEGDLSDVSVKEANKAGFGDFVLAPEITDSLDFVHGEYLSDYGRISSHWAHDSLGLVWKVHIPVNTKTTLKVPEGYTMVQVRVRESGQMIPLEFFTTIGRELKLGSGRYVMKLEKMASD